MYGFYHGLRPWFDMVLDDKMYGRSGSMCKITIHGQGTGLPQPYFVPVQSWCAAIIWQAQIMIGVTLCARCEIMVGNWSFSTLICSDISIVADYD